MIKRIFHMAQEELQKTPNGVSVQGRLRLRNGLHARPAARLAKEAQRYRSTIRLVTDAGEADCKSMLDILSLALPAEGEFTVFATGPDAREAVTAAASLLETPGD
jgi:phosphocarrier protein HPr